MAQLMLPSGFRSEGAFGGMDSAKGTKLRSLKSLFLFEPKLVFNVTLEVCHQLIYDQAPYLQ